jgi:hypothetical protein
MGKLKVTVTTGADTERMGQMRVVMSDIQSISNNIKNNFISMTSTMRDFATSQLLEPLEGIKGVVQQLSDIDLSSVTRYSSILSQIVSTTKSLAAESLQWKQQLIGIYKSIAETAKGSQAIYSMMAKTYKITQGTVMQWNEWGGYAVGIQLATELAGHATSVIGELSSDLLLTWHKQNKAIGISNEESAKMVGYMSRAGISVSESVRFQGQLAQLIQDSYKGQALTSKIMSKITESTYSSMLYTQKNSRELAKIAIQAHEWNMSIDQIYETSMKLGKAETAIETSRKLQLAFGIKLNARQMQYNAQTGKHLENVSMIRNSLMEQGIEYDSLVLAQKQIVAEALGASNIAEAQIMLMGKQKGLAETQLSPQEKMVGFMEQQNVLLTAMHDRLANFGTLQTLIRTSLWGEWSKHLDFIWGKSKKIQSVEQFTLDLEKEKMKMMSRVFLPMLARFNTFMNGKIPLLGKDSLIEKFGDMFLAIGNVVSTLGERIFTWFIDKDVLGQLTRSIQGMDITSLGNAIVLFGDKFMNMIINLTSGGGLNRLIESISGFISFISNIWWWIDKIIKGVSFIGIGWTIAITTIVSSLLGFTKVMLMTKDGIGLLSIVFNWIIGIAPKVGGALAKAFWPIYAALAAFKLITNLFKIWTSGARMGVKLLDTGKAIVNAATLGLTDSMLQYKSVKKAQPNSYTQQENPYIVNAATPGLTDSMLQYESVKKAQPNSYTQQENPYNDDYFTKLGAAVAGNMFMTEREAKTTRKGMPTIPLGASN